MTHPHERATTLRLGASLVTPVDRARALLIAPLITLAFAVPYLLRITVSSAHTARGADELSLTHLIVGAFGGATLPFVCAIAVPFNLAIGAPTRRAVDAFVAAGARPLGAFVGAAGTLSLLAALGVALCGGLTAAALRHVSHLGVGMGLPRELASTAWALAVGTFACATITAAFVAHRGRARGAAIFVIVDILARSLPGSLAWLRPSAHIDNLLGALPPSSVVHGAAFSQAASVAILLLLAFAALIVGAVVIASCLCRA